MSQRKQNQSNKLIKAGIEVIEIEQKAISALKNNINETFADACDLIMRTKGRIIVAGIGKSGHVGKKIAATFASTGTPSFFVHPAEASHGDLGMICSEDLVIAISNSGNTIELINILPLIKRLGTKLISITGNPESTLAAQSDIHLHIPIEREACPLGLAPTASTTASMVLGDALAVALLEARGFTAEDFAFSHPGGSLGKRLIIPVEDLMHQGTDFPQVRAGTLVMDALLEISEKGLGMTAVVDENNELIGIYTDGDLRRTINANLDIKSTLIETVMTKSPASISTGTLASQAAKILQDKRINGLIVLNEEKKPIGALNMQDLLRAGIT